jgi:hypothetical protein
MKAEQLHALRMVQAQEPNQLPDSRAKIAFDDY